MEIIKYPPRTQWAAVCRRPTIDSEKLEQIIRPILKDVKTMGDKALKEYTLRFDKADIKTLTVSESEYDEAAGRITLKLKDAIELAIKNITSFHTAQRGNEVRVETMPGVICWQRPVPIGSVGLYIPGGTAPLFSTILMLAIPATIAGCEEIIMCSPPNSECKINDVILYSARRVGITRLFKVGGAQAIAAMAYGTESIPKVAKILGPGNQYVQAAKQLVARDAVAIDMPAGPSEVAVLADRNSNPVFIASDLLSQAEHGPDSQVMLISTDAGIIDRTMAELERQISTLPKHEFAAKSMAKSKAIVVKDKAEMMDFVNLYAPEHLIISVSNADELSMMVKNAGSVFIGEYTPESAGDYASGTNHTLPTNGWTTAYSGVNLDSYYKKITFQKISREGLQKIGPAIEQMAMAEELTAHQRAVALRTGNEK